MDLIFLSGGAKKQGGMGRGAPRSRPTVTGPKKSADLLWCQWHLRYVITFQFTLSFFFDIFRSRKNFLTKVFIFEKLIFTCLLMVKFPVRIFNVNLTYKRLFIFLSCLLFVFIGALSVRLGKKFLHSHTQER